MSVVSLRAPQPAWSEAHRSYLVRLRRRRRSVLAARIGVLLAVLALWQGTVSLGWVDHFVVSSPVEVVRTVASLVAQGVLWIHLGTTLIEAVIGFLGGTLLGVAIAVLLWWSPFTSKVADPYLIILQAVPKIALGPVFLIWLHQYEAILAMALAISVVISVMMVLTGFRQIDPDRIKLLRTFGATRGQILAKVVLPGSLPTVMASLKVNVGMSLTGVIVGEFLVAQQGLGYLIIYGGQVFQMGLVMSGVVLLAVMAAVLYWAVDTVERRMLRWQR